MELLRSRASTVPVTGVTLQTQLRLVAHCCQIPKGIRVVAVTLNSLHIVVLAFRNDEFLTSTLYWVFGNGKTRKRRAEGHEQRQKELLPPLFDEGALDTPTLHIATPFQSQDCSSLP